jgi:DtxR family Mn-dependent transcriptional regulator
MPRPVSSRSASRSKEDFVKAVYRLQQDEDRVSTNTLKEALSISAPSVTDMAQRLMDDGLLDYRRYRGVRLTPAGETLALNIIRRHRLIELYLVQELNYALYEVHDEAENLEHAVSDRFIEAIATRLGHPAFDPHGDPIPAVDGTIIKRDLYPLSELPLDTPARVSRYISEDTGMLQHTLDRGFTLETRVEVTSRDPFDGPLTVRLHNDETIIGHNVARTILVEVES